MPYDTADARRRGIFLPAAIVAWSGSLLVTVLGQDVIEPGFPRGIRISAAASGETAIHALGERLPEVAAYYGKSPRQLREIFRSDRSLRVDRTGELYYACELRCEDCNHAESPGDDGGIAPSVGPTDPPPYDTSEAFLLHSRPGANRVILLDFDGHADASGKWKAGAESPPFDLDGNSTTFNTTERNRIIGVWQRVAEDFSMYEIDVTTEDPGIDALRKTNSSDQKYGIRVVIGGSGRDWYGSNVGGVAFVGSFDAGADIPCWVFPAGTGTSSKGMAEAASHEAGHTLGLIHDGVLGGTTYYGGQGNWAPIMGVGYGKPITQWSNGEYTDANNTQDDLAVMLTQGAVYRPDDHGGSIATATVLSSDTSSVPMNGVIGRGTDQDFFRIEAAGGTLTIHVDPAPTGPNLRLEVKLYDAGGGLLQTATSADTSDGTQPVTLTRSAGTGTYFVSVDGIGNGDPLTTGYSDYASLGQYTGTISGVVPGGFTWLPVAAGSYAWDSASNWISGEPPTGASPTVRINNNITGNQTIQLIGATPLGRLFLGDSDSTRSFTLVSGGGSLVFGNPAELSKTTGADDAITAPVSLTGELVLTQSASGSLDFSGGISGAGGLTKSGAGAVVFSTANSYTGTTRLEDGLLRLDASSGLPGGIDHTVGGGESVLVFNGGVLGITGDFTRQIGTGAGELDWDPDDGGGSGGFAAFGADREVRLNNGTSAFSWQTALIGSGETLILGHPSATHSIVLRNGISFAGSKRSVRVDDGEAVIDAVLSGVLSGGNSSGMTKTGSGVLSLTNENTYTGSTTVEDGVLRLQNPDALPSGNLELTGNGILGLGAGDFTTRTIGSALGQVRWTGSGGFAAFGADRAVKFSDSSINWNATNFIGGGRTLVLAHDTSDATLDWQQKISLAGSARTIQVDDGFADIDATISGVIAGGSSGNNNIMIKSGAGTLALTAQNTHWGDTIVSAGTLIIGTGGTVGGVSLNSQKITLETGAVLAANRSNTLTQGTDPLKPAITGDGGFSQIGSGHTVLTLANTYLGQTKIEAGALTLGSGEVVPDASDVLIGNATLAAGPFDETAASLTIAGAATIQLAEGTALSFADSSATDWSAGTLHLTGTFVPGSSLRFGNGGNGLTAFQLALITAEGFTSFALDENGYLTATQTAGYHTWAAIHAPAGTAGDDFDNDGVPNGIEYVLGGDRETNDLAKLPVVSTDGGSMSFTFDRSQASIDGSTILEIQTSPDMNDWPASFDVPDDAVTHIPGVTVVKNIRPGFDSVTLTIPLGPGEHKFARLKMSP